ncbi:MAG: SCO family protein [Propionibacteriaceae bacterium]|nr:SCO family protein [Propionibacteriaceae bacterium]
MITRRKFLAASAGVPLLAACGENEQPAATVEGGSADSSFHGKRIPGGWDIPDVTLTDQHGKPFNIRTGWNTPAAALFFGYLNCPDVCPGIMADMATARRRLGDEAAKKITPILVTTDPARDTPDALRDYLARVDDTFVGLTGDLETIIRLGEQLHIAIEKGKQLPSGGYEVDHSTQILGVGANKKVQVVWTTLGLEIGHLREDYERLIAGE